MRWLRPFKTWLPTAAVALTLAGCASSGYRWVQHQGYVVRSGDTLYAIAFRHDLDFHEVARWNHIKPPYVIYPGERLRLHAPAGGGFAHTPPVHGRTSGAGPARPGSPRVSGRDTARGRHSPAATPSRRQTHHVATAIHWRWPDRGRLLSIPDSPVAPRGINIAGHVGEPVRAAAAGRVVYSGDGLKGYGRLVIVEHTPRYLSAYGYNSKLEVKEGDKVHKGQIIARMGLGPGRKPMVHFEIRRDGKPVNPLHFLPPID